MSNRPPVTIHERTTAEWVLDAVAIAGAIGSVVVAAISYGGLPDTIPTHFGPSGEADRWGSKNMVWLIPAIAIGLIPLIIHLCRRPDRFNYLQKITPENAQSEYARARLTLRWVNAFFACLFFVLTWEITHPGIGLLGIWLLPVVIGVPFILLVLNFVPLFRKTSG